MDDREQSVQHFLDLIKRSHRGKFKIYIGMIAGVGKSYRMLQEAHELLENGVDVQIGYVETHGRVGTEAMLQGLPVISRRKIFYKGKELEEMDLDTIIRIHPEIVIVDELAHTNVEGSLNEKRWQDVMALLDEGINVISAINIQHIESVNEEVQEITGIEVQREEAREQGREEGRKQGREEGRKAERSTLIQKKLEKGKTISQIADELEDTEENIACLIEQFHLRIN